MAALRSGRCTRLNTPYPGAGWGDAEAIRIAEALEAGGGAVLRQLNLYRNPGIGAAGAARLVAAVTGGACPNLETFSIDDYHTGADALAPIAHLLLDANDRIVTGGGGRAANRALHGVR